MTYAMGKATRGESKSLDSSLAARWRAQRNTAYPAKAMTGTARSAETPMEKPTIVPMSTHKSANPSETKISIARPRCIELWPRMRQPQRQSSASQI
jgi:hypothetical protein